MDTHNPKVKDYSIPIAFEWGVLVLGVVIILLSVVLGAGSTRKLDAEFEVIQKQVTQLRSEVLDREKAERELQSAIIYETTGIDPEVVAKDMQIFDTYIRPAFEWTSGEVYDSMRDEYIDVLGEKSSFVIDYLTENVKVDDENYVDFYDLKSTFIESQVYPLVERDGAMDYIGVVSYYLYTDTADLVGINRLTTSKAIVRYTVSGADDLRTVSTIESVPGFASGD